MKGFILLCSLLFFNNCISAQEKYDTTAAYDLINQIFTEKTFETLNDQYLVSNFLSSFIIFGCKKEDVIGQLEKYLTESEIDAMLLECKTVADSFKLRKGAVKNATILDKKQDENIINSASSTMTVYYKPKPKGRRREKNCATVTEGPVSPNIIVHRFSPPLFFKGIYCLSADDQTGPNETYTTFLYIYKKVGNKWKQEMKLQGACETGN